MVNKYRIVKSSGMCRCLNGQAVPGVSKNRGAFTLRIKQSKNSQAERLDMHMYSCITKPFYLACLTCKAEGTTTFRNVGSTQPMEQRDIPEESIYVHTAHCFPFACGDDVQTV